MYPNPVVVFSPCLYDQNSVSSCALSASFGQSAQLQFLSVAIILSKTWQDFKRIHVSSISFTYNLPYYANHVLLSVFLTSLIIEANFHPAPLPQFLQMHLSPLQPIYIIFFAAKPFPDHAFGIRITRSLKTSYSHCHRQLLQSQPEMPTGTSTRHHPGQNSKSPIELKAFPVFRNETGTLYCP